MQEKQLLEILRQALWGKESKDVSTLRYADIPLLLKLAERQSVLCLVADTLCRNGIGTEYRGDMLRAVMQNVGVQEHQHQVLRRVLSALGSHDLPVSRTPIVLKGLTLARLYPNPQLRQCGDIDILVGDADYPRACDIIRKVEDADVASDTTDKHYHCHVDGVEVEVHRYAERLFGHGAFSIMPEQAESILLSGADDNEQPLSLLTPAPQTNALYIFLHLWNHFEVENMSLRQLCDLAMVLHHGKGKIDSFLLRQQIERYHLLRQWRLVGHILVHHLGLPETEMPLLFDEKAEGKAANKKTEVLAERLLSVILSGSDIGKDPEGVSLNPHPSHVEGMAFRHKLHNLHIYYQQFSKVYPFTGPRLLYRYAAFMQRKMYWFFRSFL